MQITILQTTALGYLLLMAVGTLAGSWLLGLPGQFLVPMMPTVKLDVLGLPHIVAGAAAFLIAVTLLVFAIAIVTIVMAVMAVVTMGVVVVVAMVLAIALVMTTCNSTIASLMMLIVVAFPIAAMSHCLTPADLVFISIGNLLADFLVVRIKGAVLESEIGNVLLCELQNCLFQIL